MIICYNVPEMWCVLDVAIFHFGQFFALFPSNSPKNENFKKKNEKNNWRYHHLSQVHQKSWSYAILFLRYGAWQMQMLFFILGYFLPFYPPNSTKNEYFKKMKKIPGDIIISHNCTKNHDHMLCCSWDMACGKCKYCF